MTEKKQFRSHYDPENKVGIFEQGESKEVITNISQDVYSQISNERAFEAMIGKSTDEDRLKVALGGYSSSELSKKNLESKAAGYSATNLAGLNLNDIVNQSESEKKKESKTK